MSVLEPFTRSDPSYEQLTRMMVVLKTKTQEGLISWHRTGVTSYKLDLPHGAVSVVDEKVRLYDVDGVERRAFADDELLEAIELQREASVVALIDALLADIESARRPR